MFMFLTYFLFSQVATAQPAIISQSDFSNGASGWHFWTTDNGQGKFTVENEEGKVEVINPGSNSSSTGLSNISINIIRGRKYKVEFEAKASQPLTIFSEIHFHQDPWTSYSGQKSFSLTQENQLLSYTFSMAHDTDPQAALQLMFGGGVPCIITFDNVKIYDLGEDNPHNDGFTANLDDYTVFGFSQHWNLNIVDPQVTHTSPDINIRAWQKWGQSGNEPLDFASTVISQYHENNIAFVGGATVSVYFYDEAEDSVHFLDMVTRNAANEVIHRDIVGFNAYRGNIANPGYRNYVVSMAKIQIDKGVDGIFFDEVNSGYSGATWNGNEGFDDYTIRDFNIYLAEKYPDYQKEDWLNIFDMSDTNFIDISQPLDDLDNNFNYREYLKVHGWQDNPLTGLNPLAKEWGSIESNRTETSNTFLAQWVSKYWMDIVTKTRQYAKEKYGKELFITANGLFPFVDFHSFGMYNGNHDSETGTEVNYVPVSSGRLDGSVSLQNVFKRIYKKSRVLAGSAPVVLFIDWPTEMMSDYYNLPKNDKEDYWKIYTAEAYANGLFFAFHLRTSMPDDPTAEEHGMLDFLRDYPLFYRENKSFYLNNEILDNPVALSESHINTSMMLHADSGRYTIHLVNHNYETGRGMIKKKDFPVSVSLDSVPKSVYMKSPDFSGYRALESTFQNGTLNITVESLEYYDVIILDYKNDVVTDLYHGLFEESDLKVFPNPSSGLVTIESSHEAFNGAQIFIRDLSGAMLHKRELEAFPLEFHLSPGVYIVSWNCNKSQGNTKVIVY